MRLNADMGEFGREGERFCSSPVSVTQEEGACFVFWNDVSFDEEIHDVCECGRTKVWDI